MKGGNHLEKTEVMAISLHREEINIKLEGRALRLGNRPVYIGELVCIDGQSEEEGQRRVQA